MLTNRSEAKAVERARHTTAEAQEGLACPQVNTPTASVPEPARWARNVRRN